MLNLRRAAKSSKSFFYLPRRLVLIRHGESCANVDRTLYSRIPDWKIELTAKGVEQAKVCGQELKRIVGNERVFLYHSPYVRAKQTLTHMRSFLDESQIHGEREDERLREQEVGNLQPLQADMEAIWAERQRSSRFYFRFPCGESAADVCDRVSLFLDSLFRERQELRAMRGGDDASEEDLEHNVVIVSHGLFLRIFIGRWYKLPLEVFEAMRNPPNCGIVVLERDDKKGRLVMRPTDKSLFGDDPALSLIRFDSTDNDAWYTTHMVQKMESLAAADNKRRSESAELPE